MRYTAFLVAILLLPLGCKPATMSGTWTLNKSKSTDLDQWRTVVLTIDADADHIRIRRDFSAGRYSRSDSISVPADGTPAAITHAASTKWLDSVHLGVFIDEGTVESVSAAWEAVGRKLRVESALPLQTSTGEAVVRTESTYDVSPDGRMLTVVQNRSTRAEPLTFVFDRN